MEALQPLEEAGHTTLPITPEHTTGNGHMFYLMMPNRDARDQFIRAMKTANISAPFHYVPLHSSPAGQRFGRIEGSMLETVRVSDCLVRLPMYFDLGSDVESVIDVVDDIVRKGA